MEKNSNSKIPEATICKKCMMFYANPKLGKYCSKCFSEKHPTDQQKQNPEKALEPKPDTPAKESEEKINEETRPVQVTTLDIPTIIHTEKRLIKEKPQEVLEVQEENGTHGIQVQVRVHLLQEAPSPGVPRLRLRLHESRQKANRAAKPEA